MTTQDIKLTNVIPPTSPTSITLQHPSSLFPPAGSQYYSSPVSSDTSETQHFLQPDNHSHQFQEEEEESSSCCKFPFRQFLLTFLKFVFSLSLFLTSSALTRIVTMEALVPSVDLSQPPLRDFILNRVKTFPLAFKISEYIITFLFLLLIVIACFNKTHRISILSRTLLLDSVLLLLRLITMSSTILSIPNHTDVHKCEELQHMTLKERLYGSTGKEGESALSYTCGDYMFSGHTCSIVLFTWMILYYAMPSVSFEHSKLSSIHSRRIWKIMKIVLVAFITSCCLIAMFCVIWSKEHYTCDVLVAGMITVLVCHAYHCQLNLWCLLKRADGEKENESMHGVVVLFFKIYEFDSSEHSRGNEFDLKPWTLIMKVFRKVTNQQHSNCSMNCFSTQHQQ
ncbi:hypothetical protein FDP41_007292 [Naegleria fowleri]|uniref:Sphingomyelin synthase-like domain-containing protein n=1 Tax=Naegleria fowleri TaxID=5763 RepID=A0A6A5BJR8_NAEFO|nr:uncharacterized protein FDP41_007292 [Naegleria fowleri]KAF0973905.1 hypothetical protein FDP41_007292 [Naegleria fowleri]